MATCYHNSRLTPTERVILEALLLLLQHTSGAPDIVEQISRIEETLAEPVSAE